MMLTLVSARSPTGSPSKPTSLNLASNENNGHSRSPNGTSFTNDSDRANSSRSRALFSFLVIISFAFVGYANNSFKKDSGLRH